MLVVKFSYKIMVLLFKLSVLAATPVEYNVRTTSGEEVDIKEVPYTVSTSLGCTGALIKPQWVVSAAHCFLRANWTSITIGVGAADWAAPQYRIKIEKIYVHPKYVKNVFGLVAYDIAVIKLAAPVVLSESVQLLQLQETEWPARLKRECTLAGFGDNIYYNTKLHMSGYNFTQGCDCVQDKKIICITVLEDHYGSPCFGDSGAVVVCENKGVAVTSSLLPINYCINGDSKVIGESLLEMCGNAYYLFAYIKPNLEWLKDVLHREPDTYLKSTASRLTKKSIQYYDIITTSVQLCGLAIILSIFIDFLL